VHWHFKNNFIPLITGLEQLSVGKLYYFRVHCVAFNASLSEDSEVNQLKTADDREHSVCKRDSLKLGILGGQVNKQEKILIYLCI